MKLRKWGLSLGFFFFFLLFFFFSGCFKREVINFEGCSILRPQTAGVPCRLLFQHGPNRSLGCQLAAGHACSLSANSGRRGSDAGNPLAWSKRAPSFKDLPSALAAFHLATLEVWLKFNSELLKKHRFPFNPFGGLECFSFNA